MGDTTHTLGTVLRIVTGVLIALTALPVLLTLLRSRKPEYNTPRNSRCGCGCGRWCCTCWPVC